MDGDEILGAGWSAFCRADFGVLAKDVPPGKKYGTRLVPAVADLLPKRRKKDE